MMDIAFVVLNYNVFRKTAECVKSIVQHIDTKNYKIIVVDNGSRLDVRESLKQQEAMNDEHVVVIQLEKNLGFARGNNYGIDMAKRMNAKFVCCMNNDTLLQQTNFFSVLQTKYSCSGAAVIAPLVYLRNNRIQCFNPGIKLKNEYQSELVRYQKRLKERESICKKFVKSIKPVYKMVCSIRDYRYKKKHWCDPMKERKDVILHGCCLIFTPAFFEKLNGFHPDTFLYREEELLYFMVKDAKLTTLYCPELQIRHLEDASTNSIAANDDERKRLYIKNQIDSLRILIAFLDEKEKSL